MALLANGLQVADVFIGSPAAGEFTGLNGYNVSVGTLRLARAPPVQCRAPGASR